MKIPAKAKEICAAHKVSKIQLRFNGGGDEGEFEFEVHEMIEGHPYPPAEVVAELDQLMLDWADDEFNYNGDGEDHGYDYVFDLVENTVTHNFWEIEAVYGDPETEELTYKGVDDDAI